jgi:hypothetical protein
MVKPLFRSALTALTLIAAAPAAHAQSGFMQNAFGAQPRQDSDYQRRLAAYQAARSAFEEEAEAYWSAVSEKRRARAAKRRAGQSMTLDDYVLSNPPRYDGPPRPEDPDAEASPPRERKPLPLMKDFLQAAASHYGFTPTRPASEMEFKRAYARAAMASGLTPEQAVRVYSFETGGNGGHDMQSGFTPGRPGGRAISTAIGYNQLLTANTITLLAEKGPSLFKAMADRAARASGPQRAAIEHKIAAMKRMAAVVRSVPQNWSAFEKLGTSPQGWGIHALVFDADVGPLLQVHKLLTSVEFARTRGYPRPLTAAELEMMNLTGDGNGFDMVTMPQQMREQVPTANFFQRGGYERNPVAIRHNTVAKLLAITDERMTANAAKPGARELAAAF